MGGLIADVFIEYLFRAIARVAELFYSRDWPATNGTVLNAGCPRAVYGCTVASVNYEYPVGGIKYSGTFKKPFIWPRSGEEYASQFFSGMKFKVRSKPDDPSKSVHYN